MNFKEIEGYPNYLIYEDGRVWSKPRQGSKGGWLKPRRHQGYLAVGLVQDGKQKHKNIHRLLAIHFIPNPENKPFVDHKDGIRTNNKLLNLRWVTKKENDLNRVTAKGVYFMKDDKKRKRYWRCQWFVDGKKKSKCFKTEDDAISYRQAMVDIYYNRPKNN